MTSETLAEIEDWVKLAPGEGTTSWKAAHRRITALLAEVRRYDEKDRAKTREINLLVDENRAQLAEITRLREGLEAIKSLVTGQLPTPIPLEMTTRCMRIADTIDTALGRAGEL